MNSLGRITSFILIVLLILFLLFSGLFMVIAVASMAIVPLTWLWGLMTGQSYDRVCDNSEIIYKLNQLGKWSLAIGFILGILFLVFMF